MRRLMGIVFGAMVTSVITSQSLGQASGDFNGDGFADLAVGVPGEAAGGLANSGGIHIIRGSSQKLTASGDQFWSQNTYGVLDACEDGDRFGESVAVGDFNGDGFDDLAIGVPGEDIDDVVDAGAVNVLYGTALGLRANGDQFWHQDTVGGEESCEPSDRFGRSLSAGDFDGDGFDDLAVGIPEEDTAGRFDNGIVQLLHGSEDGLTADGHQVWSGGSPGVNQLPSTDDELFGRALAAGDFNGDNVMDLAVGTPGKFFEGIEFAGSVTVICGSLENGLEPSSSQFWCQDSIGIQEVSEQDDAFGYTVTAGDFDGDGYDDLAIGTPFETIGPWFLAGSVNVVYGSATGLQSGGDEVWHQDIPGVQGACAFSEFFGFALTAGDFNGDDYADLAVGVSGDKVGLTSFAGGVNVLFGSPGGLLPNGDQYWHQDSVGIMDVAETGDGFGTVLGHGDFDGNGEDDLVVGVPNEAIGVVTGAGAVNVIYGSPQRLLPQGDQFWHQDVANVNEAAELSDQFGAAACN